MQDVMDMLKALGDENRVRILCALKGQELCVCQIIDLLGLAPSTVSKHLSILRSARLVKSRKSGRWMHYRLASDTRPSAAAGMTALVQDSLAGSSQIKKDRKRLSVILEVDKEELCGAIMKRK